MHHRGVFAFVPFLILTSGGVNSATAQTQCADPIEVLLQGSPSRFNHMDDLSDPAELRPHTGSINDPASVPAHDRGAGKGDRRTRRQRASSR